MLPEPYGGVLVGALPLILGLIILSKGLGLETTVGKIAQEMRENTDAAMFSSLLWTSTVFSAIFAVATGWENYSQEAANEASVSVIYVICLILYYNVCIVFFRFSTSSLNVG